MRTAHHVLILLTVDRDSPVAEVIAAGRHMISQTTASKDTWFPNPNPPLDTIAAEIDRLVAAENLARTKARGTAQARDIVLGDVLTSYETFRQFVQSISDKNIGREVEIAAAAGLTTKRSASHEKAPIDVESTGNKGEVLVTMKAVKNAGYEHQHSNDGGVTWAPGGYSTIAHITISGLISGKAYRFRSRPVIGQIPGDWIESDEFVVP